MELKIREASEKDIPVIVQYNLSLASETESKTLDKKTLSLGVQAAIANSERCRYFVAEQSNRVVGQIMITYEWSDWRNGCIWWIQSVYVDAEFRRQGVFKQLYQHVKDAAEKESECCGLRLYVEQENHGAQSTYKKLGMNAPGYLVFEKLWSTA